eukprot:2594676-Prorocentrum_lima.AAC.1
MVSDSLALSGSGRATLAQLAQLAQVMPRQHLILAILDQFHSKGRDISEQHAESMVQLALIDALPAESLSLIHI